MKAAHVTGASSSSSVPVRIRWPIVTRICRIMHAYRALGRMSRTGAGRCWRRAEAEDGWKSQRWRGQKGRLSRNGCEMRLVSQGVSFAFTPSK